MAGTKTHRILAFALSFVERNRLNIRKGYRILKMVNAVKTEQGTQVPGARGGSQGEYSFHWDGCGRNRNAI